MKLFVGKGRFRSQWFRGEYLTTTRHGVWVIKFFGASSHAPHTPFVKLVTHIELTEASDPDLLSQSLVSLTVKLWSNSSVAGH